MLFLANFKKQVVHLCCRDNTPLPDALYQKRTYVDYDC